MENVELEIMAEIKVTNAYNKKERRGRKTKIKFKKKKMIELNLFNPSDKTKMSPS